MSSNLKSKSVWNLNTKTDDVLFNSGQQWIHPKHLLTLMADGRHLEKSKNLRNQSTDFDEIWYSDVTGPSRYRQQIKIHDFENARWRQRPSWKFEKLQYLHNRTTDFDEIWYNDASGLFRHCQPIKFCECDNPRWRRPSSWKNEKS